MSKEERLEELERLFLLLLGAGAMSIANSIMLVLGDKPLDLFGSLSLVVLLGITSLIVRHYSRRLQKND